MAYTLAQLRTLVRQRADMERSQFVSDTELTNYVNASYAELYDLLVSRFEDYFVYLDPGTSQPPQFTLSGSVNYYALPDGFYKLRGLDVQDGGDWVTVDSYNFAERNLISSSRSRVIYGRSKIGYRIMGAKLFVLPQDSAPGTYQFWYIPRLTLLSADSDTLTNVLDFEEYIVIDAAIKCLIKEESDTTILLAMKEALRQRIMAMSSNRDAGSAQRVSDVSMVGLETGRFAW